MTVDSDEAKAVVSRIIRDNAELIGEKGIGAFKAVMGDAMKELKGRIDGRELSDIVRKGLEEAVGSEQKKDED